MEKGDSSSSGLDWALVLGASSGFGAAAAIALAEQAELNVIGVRLHRPSGTDETKEGVEAAGRKYVALSLNAANPERRNEAIERILETTGGSGLRVFLHSLAFGALKPFIASTPEEAISQGQMEMTLDVMANSLVYWAQELVRAGLLRRGSRIFAMTSSGAAHVIPSYGAVSASKAALESHIRQLAFELAPQGITANSIRAGVTDTPALRKIPGNERLVESATIRNPSGRLTTPEDVANLVALLAKPGPAADWFTGNVLGVDGGEEIVG